MVIMFAQYPTSLLSTITLVQQMLSTVLRCFSKHVKKKRIVFLLLATHFVVCYAQSPSLSACYHNRKWHDVIKNLFGNQNISKSFQDVRIFKRIFVELSIQISHLFRIKY